MWSDESRFSLFQNDGCTRVRRESHEAMDPSSIVPTVQAIGSSIIIGGCFSGYGLRSSELCGNKMKSQHYLKALNNQVIPSMGVSFHDGTRMFLDDNAMIHRVQIIQNWFREHKNSFSHMNWPP
ncbi:hypothetical protein AVEN_241130-1 [Araneus ventricosus]|uniref:Tc1-like transposase DDE domain-containing protein n=1 Tax=Araneus ventricosus TaxID=182803 RepID=A0A4Y2J8T6_ARAVE|nr:hypothetical protein AVEN_241130-1 [Araneus ventricosus]